MREVAVQLAGCLTALGSTSKLRCTDSLRVVTPAMRGERSIHRIQHVHESAERPLLAAVDASTGNVAGSVLEEPSVHALGHATALFALSR